MDKIDFLLNDLCGKFFLKIYKIIFKGISHEDNYKTLPKNGTVMKIYLKDYCETVMKITSVLNHKNVKPFFFFFTM